MMKLSFSGNHVALYFRCLARKNLRTQTSTLIMLRKEEKDGSNKLHNISQESGRYY